ncbi:MAG: N-acetylmuramic acid 6-phosphate etherase [Chloroflexi bacterium]|nr:N-acetylmuramic acid 6-phosphate etherase [Chloroflexota bacterium]
MPSARRFGSHGQSLWHIPTGSNASTLQLGEPAVIAERTGITTISNFRTRDMAAGGQGAPLVPLLDVLLLSHPTLTRAAQNIGGIGNVTYLPPHSHTPTLPHAFAFDTGPGNMLIDDAARRATDGAWTFDRDGALAAQGRVDDTLLAELMTEPFLAQQPPKTTGPELFGAQYGAPVWERAKRRGLHNEDIVATLTAFTAHSIARAYREFLPTQPDEVIVSGGGALNPVLMQILRDLVAPARVITSDDFGLPAEAKEAIAFALLAHETWHSRPGNVPAATGARHPVVLGNITPAYSHPPTLPNALTESRNAASEAIDTLSTLDMLRVMNREDERVARAVSAELANIAQAVDRIADRMQSGGRLVYIGAGTSGRLGVLDATEIPPTFSTAPDRVVAIIAGSEGAITRSMEGAEDDPQGGVRAIADLNVSERDAVLGVAASGRTPFVLGGMAEAKRRGAFVMSLACNRPSPIEENADVRIAPLVGPEILTGSTRLKAGTAQKMVLNMISTGVMIRLGKTFGNLMVDVQATNEKLRDRARRIVEAACDLSPSEAEAVLRASGGEVKTAIVAALAHVTPDEARRRLKETDGSVRAALKIDLSANHSDGVRPTNFREDNN